MAITPHTISSNYSDSLYQFLKPLEGDISFVYRDSKGIPTLGVGYALIEDIGTSGVHNWQLRFDYETELSAAGINLSQPQLDELREKLNDARDALNGTGTNPFFPAASGNNPLGWTIDAVQSIAGVFENGVFKVKRGKPIRMLT